MSVVWLRRMHANQYAATCNVGMFQNGSPDLLSWPHEQTHARPNARAMKWIS
jgi:hypothetical protein